MYSTSLLLPLSFYSKVNQINVIKNISNYISKCTTAVGVQSLGEKSRTEDPDVLPFIISVFFSTAELEFCEVQN